MPMYLCFNLPPSQGDRASFFRSNAPYRDVEATNQFHIGVDVTGRIEDWSKSCDLSITVDERHHDWDPGSHGNPIEAGVPMWCPVSGALGSDRQRHVLCNSKGSDYLINETLRGVASDGNHTESSHQGAERPPHESVLADHTRLDTKMVDNGQEQQEVPIRGVWGGNHHELAHGRSLPHTTPTPEPHQPHSQPSHVHMVPNCGQANKVCGAGADEHYAGVMADINWGVLGTARIGIEQVIPALLEADRCKVLAIASRNLGRAEEVAGEFGIERAYGSYGQLLNDNEIDAVYIPLPNHMHAQWSIAAAQAGKHILCEKPIALSSAEAESMVAAAADAGVILREAFMYQFHPAWRRTKELVDSGEIGEVVAIDSWFSFFNDDPTNIRNVLDYGGGGLMDIGCYCIHASRLIFGSEPTAIKAVVRRDSQSGVDIATSGLLEFGDQISTFACSTRTEPDQRVDIYGTDGRITVEIPFNAPSDRPTRIFITAGGKPPEAPATTTLEFDTANQYTLQAEAFAAAVLDGAPMPDTGSKALANIKVIERVFAAAGPSGWS